MNKPVLITIASVAVVLAGGTVAAQRVHRTAPVYHMNNEDKEHLGRVFYQQQAMQLSFESRRTQPNIDTAGLAFQYGMGLAPLKTEQEEIIHRNCLRAGIQSVADCAVNLEGEVTKKK